MERLWRTVKYEEVQLKAYASVLEAQRRLGRLFPVLQRAQAPPGPGLPDASRGLPWGARNP